MYDAAYIILSAVAVLITLSIHEFAHALAAYKLGDGTAKAYGRLSINPIKHLDPIGALCMLLFKVGWAKPVPINPRNFKNPKRDFAISALAGPLANLILAFVFSGVYILTFSSLKDVMFESGSFSLKLAENLLLFLQIFFSVNVGLGIFNLLPIPPFDGSRLLNVILPEKLYFEVMRYERQIYFGVLGWLLLGDYVATLLRNLPLIASNRILYLLAGVFSLSDMLGAAISYIGNLMVDFWLLIIPF